MAIRKVARMGHPVLRQNAQEIDPKTIGTPEFKRLIQDMVDTMAEYGGIGLAAPQIHESIRLAIIGFDGGNERYPEMGEQPLSVLINPRYRVIDSESQGFWEGCLSVPGLRGLVYRPRAIEVTYLDLQGKTQKVVAEDFLSTVFQHELDHLDGVLYVDRIDRTDGPARLAFQEEYERYLLPQAEADGVDELPD